LAESVVKKFAEESHSKDFAIILANLHFF